MTEVQRHGFDFENWVKETSFDLFQAKYTQKWDVPIEANCLKTVPETLRNLPVSIKTCKFGSPIRLGDAVRQFNNTEDFLLVVGFWKQSGKYKNFVAVEAIKIITNAWKSLVLPLGLDDLMNLDSAIKNTDLHYSEARKIAKEIKKTEKFKETKIILNPKIDSKTQRRLQCSLPFSVFWNDFVKKQPYQKTNCELFGQKVPNPFLSSQRTFKPKLKLD